MNQLIDRFEKQNLSLEISEIVPFYKAKAKKIVSKAKFPKPEFYYRFKNYENMIAFCEDYILKIEKQQAEKERIKNEKKKAVSDFKHNFYEGQILYSSWGYEQTNLSYYQIIAFKGKSVILQKIFKKEVSQTSWASAMCEPVKNSFIGEPFIKRIVPNVDYGGNISYHISMGDSVGRLMEHKEGQQNYSSWYA
jgi:hypothetical protein